jgi:hypothetical protein
MIIECSSNVFHVAQPSGYGREYTWEEEQANEDYQHFLDERIREKFQRYFNFKGLKNYKGTKRRNLPEWHPCWATDGHYEVNGPRYLEKIIAPAWMALLDEQFRKRADGNINVTLEATGVDSPKYYNYMTDAALFRIHISAEDLEKVRQHVFVHSEVFEKYLWEYCGHGPGFASSRPYQSLAKWEEYFAKQPVPWSAEPPYHEHWELAFWCLLEFWLFAFNTDDPEEPPSLERLERNLDRFGEAYEWRAHDYQSDIHYSEYMDFVPACPEFARA